MPSNTFLSRLAAGWFILLLALSSESVNAFTASPLAKTRTVTASPGTRSPFAAATNNQSSKTSLRSLTAAPMEEKEREKKKKDEENDWTRTRSGGFLPNLRGKRRKRAGAIIQKVTTLQDYKQVVVEEPNKLVVVHWYGPWCRTCKAIAPKIKQMAAKYKDQVKFVKVPVVPATALLHQGLDVPSVPFGHIYHPEAGLVEELKMNKKEIGHFKETLQHYVNGECLLPNDEHDNEQQQDDIIGELQ